MVRQYHFCPTCFMRKKESMGQLQLHALPFQLFCQKNNGQTFKKDERISRMIKGIFKLHTSLPEYLVTYDLDIILLCIDSLPANNLLSIDLLIKKLYFALSAEWTV